MESSRKKKLFDENGKLKPVNNKKTAVKPIKEKSPYEKPKKKITVEQFLEQQQTPLGVESKWDNYEHVIRTNGRVCAWVCDRQHYVSLSIFPPFNEKWKTIWICKQAQADNAIIMLKAKINGYSPKK